MFKKLLKNKKKNKNTPIEQKQEKKIYTVHPLFPNKEVMEDALKNL